MGSKSFDKSVLGQTSQEAPGPARSSIDPEDDLPVVEIHGTIKWFDVSKGFGFIVPDDGTRDVLLHVTCLRNDGFQTAHEGARIVCEAISKPRGMQAVRIISMDSSTAIHPSQMPPARTHVEVEPESGLEEVEVKWFNRTKGFGFLTRDDGQPDAFVHISAVERSGLSAINEGERYQFDLEVDRRGKYSAVNLVPAE